MQHPYNPKTQQQASRIIKGGKPVNDYERYEEANNTLLKITGILVCVLFVIVVAVIIGLMF